MSDILSHATLLTDLVSYWKLEEASGATRVDSHGSNDLTDSRTVPNDTGKFGNGALFVGANDDYLTISDASQTGLDATGDFSVSFWYKPTTLSGGYIFSKWRHASHNQYRLDLSSTAFTLYTSDACSGYSYSGKSWTHSMTAGVMAHYVLTYNRTTGAVEMFKNGVSLGTGTVKSAIKNCSGAFVLASQDGAYTNTADGLLDEFGFWSKILSGAEISDLYNGGDGLPYDYVAPAVTGGLLAMMD
ncbi:LamG domain-containing protein [Candidatus Kaiserbacteria bacterium]|nr:LamG domain-containing protein [Candidatus Kaiserbacteria bacterium]